MSVTISQLFDFFAERPSCSLERCVVASAAFGELRRSLRSMIVSLSEIREGDAAEIAFRLRSALSEWLTVPVQFDNTILLALGEMGEAADVEARWGCDFRSTFDDACRTAQQLVNSDNPVRTILVDIVRSVRQQGRSFRIVCHRRSRRHFESLFAPHDEVSFAEDVFIHSVAEYRESGLFDVLLKVGPLRSRGWGSVPDALLTAPRYKTLSQVVWSGCTDEPGFGYDPVSSQLSVGGAAHESDAVADRYTPSFQLRWEVHETRSGDYTSERNEDGQDIDEFEVFTMLTQTADFHRATLVQVNDDHGIFYPPHSKVLGLDMATLSVGYRLPGEMFLEGMYLILPLVDDSRLVGFQAEDGHFSMIWKEKLNAEYRLNPVTLAHRLWDAGLQLLHLQGRIAHWCKPSTTVIHAPQVMQHFEILIKVLEIDFDPPNRPSQARRAAWWQFAWDEVRRSRGEAIHSGVLEQQVVDEQVLTAINALDESIRGNIGRPTFEITIPPSHPLQGTFRFYRVLAVEEGYQVPAGQLRILYELSRSDQWRV